MGCDVASNVEATNIFTQECDKTLPAQGLDCFRYFWAESFDMVSHEVILQSFGMSPHKRAKGILVRGHVSVPHVSSKSLDSPEVFATIRTGRVQLVSAGRGTISPLGLGLGVRRWCVLIHSKVILGDACLIGGKVGLLSHLNQKKTHLSIYMRVGWKCQGQEISSL